MTAAPAQDAEKALTLALRLSQAERALHAFSSDQIDAIVDPDGNTYLLRPAQVNLRQNERRLQAIIDSAADVITVISRSGVILSQSCAVRRVFGYEPQELVGKSIFELIYQEDVDRLYTAFFNVIEGFQENATVQFYHPTSDGLYRMVEATVGKLNDVCNVVLILRPISELPREEPKLSACEILPASDNRDSILVSHERRMPLTNLRLPLDDRGFTPI